MEKKKRLFYLDFIRVLSMIIIVTYHFCAHFGENNITALNITNGKWGQIGVALFFMISGASLMYNYKDKFNLKDYAKKRFVGIYPMFWIAYILLYVYIFMQCKGPIGGNQLKLVFSIFAMDGYLSPYVPTIYLIGEWFLGCIILIYILFPILRKLVNKYPKLTIIVATIIYISLFFIYKNLPMQLDKTLIVSIYGFLLGMYIIKIKDIKWWQMLIALAISILGYISEFNNFNAVVFVSKLTGYSLFIVLIYIAQLIQKMNITKLEDLFALTGRYSYAIFLVHHYTIMKIESEFQNQTYGVVGTLILYLSIWVVIIILAKLLYNINKSIIKFFVSNGKDKVSVLKENKKEVKNEN